MRKAQLFDRRKDRLHCAFIIRAIVAVKQTEKTIQDSSILL